MFGRGCMRCSTCGINYPLDKHACEVIGCGERLRGLGNERPHEDWVERVAELNRGLAPSVLPAVDELHEHRASRFETLGFTSAEASALACAKNDDGFALYWGDVARQIKRGMTLPQAFRFFVA